MALQLKIQPMLLPLVLVFLSSPVRSTPRRSGGQTDSSREPGPPGPDLAYTRPTYGQALTVYGSSLVDFVGCFEAPSI